MKILQMDMLAPIPVGRRVRITCFVQELGTLAKAFERPREGYLVADTEAGIEYSPDFIWSDKQEQRCWHYSETPQSKVSVREQYEGTVRACRVVTRSGNAGNHRITTRLSVEED